MSETSNILPSKYIYNSEITSKQSVAAGLLVTVALAAIVVGSLALTAVHGGHIGIFQSLGNMHSLGGWLMLAPGLVLLDVTCILLIIKLVKDIRDEDLLNKNPLLNKNFDIIDKNFEAFSQKLNYCKKLHINKNDKKYLIIPVYDKVIPVIPENEETEPTQPDKLIILKEINNKRFIEVIPNRKDEVLECMENLANENFTMYVGYGRQEIENMKKSLNPTLTVGSENI